MRDSADSAVLGMVGGRYGFEKREVGECFQIGNSGVVGNSGVAHPQRDGVGGQKGTDISCLGIHLGTCRVPTQRACMTIPML